MNETQPFENVKIYKEMYGHPEAVWHSVGMAIHFFVNFDDSGTAQGVGLGGGGL